MTCPKCSLRFLVGPGSCPTCDPSAQAPARRPRTPPPTFMDLQDLARAAWITGQPIRFGGWTLRRVALIFGETVSYWGSRRTGVHIFFGFSLEAAAHAFADFVEESGIWL